MKWLALVGLAALVVISAPVSAQQRHSRQNRVYSHVSTAAAQVLPIGNIAKVDDTSPKWWAISGYFIVPIQKSAGEFTPLMRTEVFDARTVEILSRAQVPPVRSSDVRAVGDSVVVRRYLLMQVLPQDARAAGMSQHALAEKWARAVGRVLPQIAPTPSRFGI